MIRAEDLDRLLSESIDQQPSQFYNAEKERYMDKNIPSMDDVDQTYQDGENCQEYYE